jgi:stage II sporulation protein D
MRVLRTVTIAAILVGTIACATGHGVTLPSAPAARPALSRDLRVKTLDKGWSVIRMVPVEDYVQATTLSEFAPASGEATLVERMLEVQSIISRTFALTNRGRHGADGYDVCSSTHCQIYEPGRLKTSRWRGEAETALAKTRGTVLFYESIPAEAVFHADCGGYTAAAEDVWGGGGRRYLLARPDDAAGHATWDYALPIAQARAALNKDARSRIGQRLDAIEIEKRDKSGRATSVRIRGTRDMSISGEDLRFILTQAFGARTIKSTLFDVKRTGDKLIFTGRGFGHGVGLCQAGALARLRRGDSPEAVLKYYFPGARMRRM